MSTPMNWTVAADRKLLLFALGKECSNKEYRKMSAKIPGNPTGKEIAQRLRDLRKEQITKLEAAGFDVAQLDLAVIQDGYDTEEEREMKKQKKILRGIAAEKKTPSKDVEMEEVAKDGEEEWKVKQQKKKEKLLEDVENQMAEAEAEWEEVRKAKKQKIEQKAVQTGKS